MSKFHTILEIKRAELDANIDDSVSKSDNPYDSDYYRLLGMCQEDKNTNTKAADTKKLVSAEASLSADCETRSTDINSDKSISCKRFDPALIKTIFEEKYALCPSGDISFLGSRHYRTNSVGFFLLSFSAVVCFSVLISRSGHISTFATIDAFKEHFSGTRRFNDSDYLGSSSTKISDSFFNKLFASIDIKSLQEHFYHVFELSLTSGNIGFIDGDFHPFNKEINFLINLSGRVKFVFMVDDYENFLGVFSERTKEGVKNEIRRILRFSDSKLNIKMI